MFKKIRNLQQKISSVMQLLTYNIIFFCIALSESSSLSRLRNRITGGCVSNSLALRSVSNQRSSLDCFLSLESNRLSPGLWLSQFQVANGECHEFSLQSVCRLLPPAGEGCEFLLSSRLNYLWAAAHFSAVWEASDGSMDTLLCGQHALTATDVNWTETGALLSNSTSVLMSNSLQNVTQQSSFTWIVRASRPNGTRCFMEFTDCQNATQIGANLWEFSEFKTPKDRYLLSRLGPGLKIESKQPVLPDDPDKMVTVGVAFENRTNELKLLVDNRFLQPYEVDVLSSVMNVNLPSCLKIGRRSLNHGWLAGTVQVVALSQKFLSAEDIVKLFMNN